ncbi:hypothetical protein B0T10DRAFT_487770 [Thelonectria olida]|uniref:F-box domain-containing protein n=1 Tax=Thelonectria olida TaxID=1576542 RepID=A0A9P9ALT0_9HYPO|nr:hypothetical protein B0T10DRAFT_487770 [Thelonectria olida]
MANPMDLAFILSGGGCGPHQETPIRHDEPPDPARYNGGIVLTQLPIEVLHQIFKWLPIIDVLEIPRACSYLRAAFKHHPTFYRDVYLQHLDTPRKLTLDWEREVRRLARFEVACLQRNSARELNHLFVYNIITHLLHNATPNNSPVPEEQCHAPSRNLDLLQRLFKLDPTAIAFMQQSTLFTRARDASIWSVHDAPSRDIDPSATMKQQSAKLHVLYGRPIFSSGRMRSARTYPYACSKVFDMRRYTHETRWGPYLVDGSGHVDWEMLEAIMVVVGFNFPSNWRGVSHGMWNTLFQGAWPNSSRFIRSCLDSSSLEARDPYGVTGRWKRTFAFIDYGAYREFNFMADLDRDPIEDEEDRPVLEPKPRMALDVPGHFRHCDMCLRVRSIDPPGAKDGQDLPVVSFDGRIEGGNVINSAEPFSDVFFRGTVRLTRENEVRWTTGIIPDGQVRWRSEGIQVGGVRSARGVVGTWFPSNYEIRDPCGPMLYWKISGSPD